MSISFLRDCRGISSRSLHKRLLRRITWGKIALVKLLFKYKKSNALRASLISTYMRIYLAWWVCIYIYIYIYRFISSNSWRYTYENTIQWAKQKKEKLYYISYSNTLCVLSMQGCRLNRQPSAMWIWSEVYKCEGVCIFITWINPP